MNNELKPKRSGMNVGTSLILVTFVLLCLVAFAALAYSSAYADYTLSQETAARVSDYYKACNEAEHRLAEIEQSLAKTDATADASYYNDNDTFIVDINENQQLEVRFVINSANHCEIVSYKTIVNTVTDEQPIKLLL